MVTLQSDLWRETWRAGKPKGMQGLKNTQADFLPCVGEPEAEPYVFEGLGSSGVRPYRIALLLSHPVQYFSPLFRRLSQQHEIDLTVIYCSLQGSKKMKDPEFRVSFAWDLPLLEGYRYKELRNYWPGKLSGFFSCINPGIITELRSREYDAIIVFGWGSMTTWLAFTGAMLAGIPWMLYGDTNVLQESSKGAIKSFLRRTLLTMLFSRTAAFLASGGFNRTFYQRMGAGAECCFAAPMSVDNEFFRKEAKSAQGKSQAVRKEYGIPSELVIMLFCGKLASHKRPQDILGALEILQADFPILGGLFVGDGALRERLQNEAAHRKIANVFFLGFRNQTELPQIYACADCMVLPSSIDARGLAVNEAMACGLPVIVSDHTGVWGPEDIVRHGDNGFVYPCGDVDALAKAMRKLASDPELRHRMGNRSREIIQNCSYAKCVEGILSAVKFLRRKRA